MSGSYKVTLATRGSALEPLERWLLTCVGMRAGEDGTCWASVATLVDDSGIPERTTQDILRRLVVLGALERQDRKGASAVYRIRLEGILPTGPRPEQAAPYWKASGSRTPATPAPPQEPHAPGAGAAPLPPQEPHPTPAGAAPNSSSDPSSDPSNGSEDDRSATGGQRTILEPDQPTLLDVDPVADRLLARWNLVAEKLPERNRAAKRHRTESGAGRALRARVNEYGAEAVSLVLDWFEHAPDAEWGRNPTDSKHKGLGLMSLMYPRNFPSYLDDAEAWKRRAAAEAARAPPAPPPDPPPRAAPVLPPAPGSTVPLRRKVLPP